MKYLKAYEEINWSKLVPKKWVKKKKLKVPKQFKSINTHVVSDYKEEIKNCLFDLSDIAFHIEAISSILCNCMEFYFYIKKDRITDEELSDNIETIGKRIMELDDKIKSMIEYRYNESIVSIAISVYSTEYKIGGNIRVEQREYIRNLSDEYLVDKMYYYMET